jgi:hypothetical protein
LQERNLKLDAFQRVDNLQSLVYDLEDDLASSAAVVPANAHARPHTTLSNYKLS